LTLNLIAIAAFDAEFNSNSSSSRYYNTPTDVMPQ
jgi:hypothetical protein